MSSNHKERETPFIVSLLAGGLAGTTVDVALFPIDTLKTRLQSPSGFRAAGGFKGIYNGLGAAALGSSPGAALFFGVYENFKVRISNYQNDHENGILGQDPAVAHMMAASAGEAAACLIRVPTEVVKQNMQIASDSSPGFASTVRSILAQKSSGGAFASVFGGLYRGYGITLMREVPFALIQFPLYERFKLKWGEYRGAQVSPLQAAACGSVSGGIAAAFTTPLDVVKTRLMLGKDKNGIIYKNAFDVGKRIVREEGWRTFLSGIEPRVMWISIGGFVFFGAYEEYRALTMKALNFD